MQAKQFVIPAGVLVVAVVIYVYLKGGNAGADTQVSYPNANAGGLPQYKSPSVAYNFGTRQAAPSPNLVYGPPPAIPPTPTYQKYNYSPINIFSLTPEAASKLLMPTSDHGKDCCCNDCGCRGNHPMYNDSNTNVGVVANKAEQVRSIAPMTLGKLTENLATSAANDNELAWNTVAKHIGNPFIYTSPGQ